MRAFDLHVRQFRQIDHLTIRLAHDGFSAPATARRRLYLYSAQK
jgi:hypothetical protein